MKKFFRMTDRLHIFMLLFITGHLKCKRILLSIWIESTCPHRTIRKSYDNGLTENSPN